MPKCKTKQSKIEALTENTLFPLGFAQINLPPFVRRGATFPPRQGQRQSFKIQFFVIMYIGCGVN